MPCSGVLSDALDVWAADHPSPSGRSRKTRRKPPTYPISGKPHGKASARGCSVRNRTATKGRFLVFPLMAAADPELERLLKAERLASERYERLRGYPGNVQEVALALKTEA